ncbi:MAG: MBL fold metallo-hydrolase [Planctomycetaceae bacterium]|nr:MBL fold metallo-hydrolase [Planctomycetaceae bacterium]
MIHQILAVGPLQCNCHILADEASKEAIIVDPGDDPEEILRRVKGYTVRALLHTHCHFDHMTGTRRVAEATGAEILIHQADKAYYDSLAGQYRMFGMPRPVEDPLPVKRFLKDGDRIDFGKHGLEVIHTPGHTQGSCCFHAEGKLLSGDTLFQRSIGRTDLPGGNAGQELDSIRKRLFTLDPETIVYPGHGPETQIGEERAENPFLAG